MSDVLESLIIHTGMSIGLDEVIPAIKVAFASAFEEVIMTLKESIDRLRYSMSSLGHNLYHMLIPVKHSIIVDHKDVGTTMSLIKRYTIFKRRVRVKSRVCDGSTNNGQYKLTFCMTNAQYANLMTKLRIRKFNYRIGVSDDIKKEIM